MQQNYQTKVFPLKQFSQKQFVAVKTEIKNQKQKPVKTFFKNAYNQEACVLAIGPQGSGKSTLFNEICDLLKDKNKSFLYFISSLPKREVDKEVEKIGIKEFKIYSHQDKEEYFEIIYNDLLKYSNDFEQGREEQKNKEKLKEELRQLRNKQRNNLALQTKIEEKLLQIKFYEENKDVQIKFFIYIDDLLKLQPKQIPFYELILRNYRHLGGVFFYTTVQAVIVIQRQLRDLFTHLVLFKNIPESRLETISEQQRLPLSKEEIYQIYYQETREKHSYIIICAGQGIPAIQTKNNLFVFL